jgi:hypothetical protein
MDKVQTPSDFDHFLDVPHMIYGKMSLKINFGYGDFSNCKTTARIYI